MRIVFLNPVGVIGGAERSLLDLLASLRKSHPAWDLHLIAGEPGPIADAADSCGISVHVLKLPRELSMLGDAAAGGPAGHGLKKSVLAFRWVRALNKTFGYLRALRNLLRSLEPSIIHSNGFKMHILAIWAKPSGVPLVWHIHDYVASRPVMRILMRIHSRGCSAVIANSDSVARDLRGVCGQKLRTHKLWNAVDLAEFSPEGSQLDLDQLSGLSAPEQPVLRVGLVGTFARWKGHDIFLRSLAMLPAEIPVRGYIVGGPLYQTDGSQWRLEDLRQMANKLGLAGRIGFTGFVSRPAEAMRALDIVVHASTEPEPFGLVIVEAMACGRPVITTRWGGASEITGGDSGALAHIPGDPSSLADRIVQLAGNPSLRQRLSLAGRGNAEKRFDRASLGPACADIYESVARTALFSLSSQLAR